MSIAWASILLLMLLLPGFLFFVGLYFPEEFTREIGQRSPLGQMAGVLVISFAVHGALYCIAAGLPGWIPRVDLLGLLSLIDLEHTSESARTILVSSIEERRWWIASYFAVTTASGTLLGWATGTLVVQGRFRFLAQHTWIYDLAINRSNSLTCAYVMTDVKEGERILIYRGFLKAFGLGQDGRFSYLVLRDAVRFYMHMDPALPRTSPPREWLVIGEQSAKSQEVGIGPGDPLMARAHRYLMVEGQHVVNVVFDCFRYPPTLGESLDRLIQEQSRSSAKTPLPGTRADGSSGTSISS